MARGFSLLEVLIALAVLAIASLAVLGQVRQSVAQQQLLNERYTAALLAENSIEKLLIAEDWPPVGRGDERVESGHGDFNINTDVLMTSEPWLRKIVVIVSRADSDTALVELTAYRGKY
jgi:general secretion pathway protein I